MKSEPHQVQWTPEKIANFWRINHSLFARRRYSQQVGGALTKLIMREVAQKQSRILDYGCGDGALLSQMVNNQTLLVGHDFDQPTAALPLPDSSVQLSRIRRDRFYYASQSRLDELAGFFDAVVLIEVVEHLHDEQLNSVLATIKQVLKPGGKLFITTPLEESLAQNTVNCPDCNCVFHRVQHVRSWSADTLGSYVQGRGFMARKVFAADLGRMQRSTISRWVHTAVDILDRRKLPHLVGTFEKY